MYDVGDKVTAHFNTFNTSDVSADATAVTLTVEAPDGTAVAVTPTKTSTGVYTATVTATAAGLWLLRWSATGTNAGGHTDVFYVDDPATPPMVSMADAKAHLGITSTADDQELRGFLAAATSACEQYTGRVWGRRVLTETPQAAGHTMFTTMAVPVLSVLEVTDDGAVVTDWTACGTSGVVRRDAGVWGDTLTVEYVAGAVVIPPHITQGVKEMLRHLWETQRGTKRVLPGDDWDPGQGYSVPRRVAELWDGATMTGLA